MTLKSAALLALIGMILLSAMQLAHLIVDVSGAVRGLVPAVRVLESLIDLLASGSLAVLLWVFHKGQR
jgi:hypothetical protein